MLSLKAAAEGSRKAEAGHRSAERVRENLVRNSEAAHRVAGAHRVEWRGVVRERGHGRDAASAADDGTAVRSERQLASSWGRTEKKPKR